MLYQEALYETVNALNEEVKEAFLLHGKVSCTYRSSNEHMNKPFKANLNLQLIHDLD